MPKIITWIKQETIINGDGLLLGLPQYTKIQGLYTSCICHSQSSSHIECGKYGLWNRHTHTHFLKIIHMIWIIYDLNMKHMNRISESCVNFNHKDFAWLYYIHLCSFDREWSWLWMLSDSSWAHLAQWFLMGSYDPWLLPPLMVFFSQCLTGMKPFSYFLHELNMVAMDQRSVLHWQENMSHSWKKKVIQCTLDLRKPFTLISEVIIPISFEKTSRIPNTLW